MFKYMHVISLQNITLRFAYDVDLMVLERAVRDVCVCSRFDRIIAHLSNQYLKLSTDHCDIMLNGYRD